MLYFTYKQSPSVHKIATACRCTYSQCMPCAHLRDLWTNTCGLVGVARAFGLVSHACATKCEKCEKEGKVYTLRWKSLRMWARFWTAQNAKIWSLSRRPHALFALLGAAALSHTHHSWCGLHGIEAAFTLRLLHFRTRLLAHSSSLWSPFAMMSWQWDC